MWFLKSDFLLKRGSGCYAVDSLFHSSLNLAFRQLKSDDIFIFAMAYFFFYFEVNAGFMGAMSQILITLELEPVNRVYDY